MQPLVLAQVTGLPFFEFLDFDHLFLATDTASNYNLYLSLMNILGPIRTSIKIGAKMERLLLYGEWCGCPSRSCRVTFQPEFTPYKGGLKMACSLVVPIIVISLFVVRSLTIFFFKAAAAP